MSRRGHRRLLGEDGSATSPLIFTRREAAAHCHAQSAFPEHRAGSTIGRVDVAETGSISAGIAERYATAVFDIANENKSLDGLERGVAELKSAFEDSEDFRVLISSPMVSRDEQGGAIAAIAKAMKLDDMLSNTLQLMATKRRLFVLPQLVDALRRKLSEARGEVTAEVVSAKALTAAQTKSLSAALADAAGKNVTLNATVDENLIGGLVVKMGSKMIDTSIRSKLGALQNAMKEVG
jgi:F-type H+-transporting ATPase subunit delta